MRCQKAGISEPRKRPAFLAQPQSQPAAVPCQSVPALTRRARLIRYVKKTSEKARSSAVNAVTICRPYSGVLNTSLSVKNPAGMKKSISPSIRTVIRSKGNRSMPSRTIPSRPSRWPAAQNSYTSTSTKRAARHTIAGSATWP